MRPCPSGVRSIAICAPDALEPDDAVHPITLDRRLALQLESELGEERDRVLEVVDDYAHVVDPLDRHVVDGRQNGPARLIGRGWARYPAQMPSAPKSATLVMWFHLRSPELAEEFERFMAGDRDLALGSLDTVSDWRLTRPLNVPGQASEPADYVLIAEITELDRWQEEASEQVELLADGLGEFVSARKMLVVEPVL